MKKEFSDFLNFKKWILIYLKPLLLAPNALANDEFIKDIIEQLIATIKSCPSCEHKWKIFFIVYLWKLVYVPDLTQN